LEKGQAPWAVRAIEYGPTVICSEKSKTQLMGTVGGWVSKMWGLFSGGRSRGEGNCGGRTGRKTQRWYYNGWGVVLIGGGSVVGRNFELQRLAAFGKKPVR